MALTAQLVCFFVNDTSEWLKGPDGNERTRNISEALVVRPEEVELLIKDKHLLSKGASISMHLLEATFVLKRKAKLS
jgi:hypothetical protein